MTVLFQSFIQVFFFNSLQQEENEKSLKAVSLTNYNLSFFCEESIGSKPLTTLNFFRKK